MNDEASMAGTAALLLVLIVVAVAAFAAIPLALIWSLNTLFGLGIIYSVWTWLAAGVLLALVPRSFVSKGK